MIERDVGDAGRDYLINRLGHGKALSQALKQRVQLGGEAFTVVPEELSPPDYARIEYGLLNAPEFDPIAALARIIEARLTSRETTAVFEDEFLLKRDLKEAALGTEEFVLAVHGEAIYYVLSSANVTIVEPVLDTVFNA